MVRPERFELPTYCSGGNRSIHLGYGRTGINLSVYREPPPVEARTGSGESYFPCGVGRPSPQSLPAVSASSSTTATPTTVASAAAAATTGTLHLGARLVHIQGASAY